MKPILKPVSVKWSILIISILIPIFIGRIAGLLTAKSSMIYSSLKLPPLSPPAILFPIVWTLLYFLMGLSAYVIFISDCEFRKKGLVLYIAQLALNFVWPLLFFNLKAYLTAFVCLAALWWLVLQMILTFAKCNKKAAYLQIPYLLWLTFAAYLNLGVFFLNL